MEYSPVITEFIITNTLTAAIKANFCGLNCLLDRTANTLLLSHPHDKNQLFEIVPLGTPGSIAMRYKFMNPTKLLALVALQN